MITRELLENIRSLSSEKNELEGIMRRHCMAPPTSTVSATPRSFGTGDPTGREASKRADLDVLWRSKLAELDGLIREVEEELKRLDSVKRRIVRLYYFEGMGDRRIANLMRFNFDVIGRKRREAVEILTGGEDGAEKNDGKISL